MAKVKLGNEDDDKVLGQKNDIEHPEFNITVLNRKAFLSRKAKKVYKTIITYVQLTDDEAKIKRAIIGSIIKKAYKK
ncbi:hypothetical protein [Pedobacter steynii]|uniref:Uncharacterized protein n=1 Tax=Pedobacter steynii TaxID=430522 RepID=A0A1D7QN44_9SPHI|nr:hypothetical protein [Pedobacter steynii]AOM80086.1 hypothetical protein BFS30_24745 [Pedobacter steynii]